MKKIMSGLIAIVMAMTCFLSNVSALELDIPTTSISLDETITITDLQNEEGTIYEFTLEEDCVVDMNVSITFKDDATKDISVQVINEAYMQDLLNGLMGNETSGKTYCVYGENTTVSTKTYQFHQQYKMEKGVYWFSLSCLGEIDYETFDQAEVSGKAKVKFSIEEDEVQYIKTKYTFKESEWFETIKPITLTTVKGFKSPLSSEMLFVDESERVGYTLNGFYVYRKRDNAWLYAKSKTVYDPLFDEETIEYSSFKWYPLGTAPKGYERYAVGSTLSDAIGGDCYATETMKNGDQLIHREVWTANTYKIRYHANTGGKGTMKNSYFTYDKTKKLRANTFTHKTKKFKGWKAKYYNWWADTDMWYYTNGKKSGWYEEGQQPKGWTKYIFKNQEKVKNLTAEQDAVIHMYAVWR